MSDEIDYVKCDGCGLEQPRDKRRFTICIECHYLIRNPPMKFKGIKDIGKERIPMEALEAAGLLRTEAYKSYEVTDTNDNTWIIRFDMISSVSVSKPDCVSVTMTDGKSFIVDSNSKEEFLFEYRRYLRQR